VSTVWRYRVPLLFALPLLVLIGVFLIYPTFDTIRRTFLGPASDSFVGLDNYKFLFTNDEVLRSFRNNLLWLGVFTSVTLALGLFFAVLADRVRYEAIIKAIIFIPMAISFTAAGVIWSFVYKFKAEGLPQIGLADAVVTGILWPLLLALVFGLALFFATLAYRVRHETVTRAVAYVALALSLATVGVIIFYRPDLAPQVWLERLDERWLGTFNNLALILVGIWMWTGFAMVILSAGLKSIPSEILEAARVDGANEWKIFTRITLPMITPTITVVAVTLIINVLKIFDIIFIMTGGRFETDVLANRMWKEMFVFRDFGHGSAIAVLLLVLILPIMFVNIRRFRREEAGG